MLRLFKREYSNYSMHAGRLVSNVLTSMLSGVPGSINREPLESSLLTTWPFWAGRPGANTMQYFLMFWTETSLWIKLCVNIVYSCVAVVLRACVLMIMDDVNRKRPDAICTGQHVLIWTHRGLSPWQCWFSCYLWNPLISGHLWSPGWPQGRSENWVAVKMYTVIYKTLASGFSQLRQSNAQTLW